MKYRFYISIDGEGKNEQDAWDDAVAQFDSDPGATPEVICGPANYRILQEAFNRIDFWFPRGFKIPKGA